MNKILISFLISAVIFSALYFGWKLIFWIINNNYFIETFIVISFIILFIFVYSRLDENRKY